MFTFPRISMTKNDTLEVSRMVTDPDEPLKLAKEIDDVCFRITSDNFTVCTPVAMTHACKTDEQTL